MLDFCMANIRAAGKLVKSKFFTSRSNRISHNSFFMSGFIRKKINICIEIYKSMRCYRRHFVELMTNIDSKQSDCLNMIRSKYSQSEWDRSSYSNDFPQKYCCHLFLILEKSVSSARRCDKKKSISILCIVSFPRIGEIENWLAGYFTSYEI